mmetsp:Transcript_86933/g.156590  ORF Transcript_86933/g.156590 Transcript_86933/m.156590 type:complete len:228 (+) Transcript_86933:80-763(+)
MRRLFGWGKEEERAAATQKPSLAEASDRIETQVKNLEEKIQKADGEIRDLVSKGSTNPTAKQRAMQAMKRKKMYEQQRDQYLATQYNIENQAFALEQAEVQAVAVQAMQNGMELLKDQHQKININSVDKLTDDMAELQDEMKQINDALAQSSMLPDGADEDALNEEYSKMEEELAAMALAGGAFSTSASAAPAVPAAAVAASASSSTAEAVLSPTSRVAQAVPSAPP